MVYAYKFVCTMPMLIVSVGTMYGVVAHAVTRRTLIYWRLVAATTIMFLIYYLQMLSLGALRDGHGFDLSVWS